MDFLDLLGVPYHALVVFFLGTDFLFKSILAYCVYLIKGNKIRHEKHYASGFLTKFYFIVREAKICK